MTKPKKKARLTLELPIPVRDRLGQLVQETDAGSMVEVLKRSIALYDEIVSHPDCTLILRSADGVERIIILI